MATTRQRITRAIASRSDAASYVPTKGENILDIFGAHVFGETVMRERLPKDVYKSLNQTIKKQAPLDPSIAEIVASTMKNWAIELGATHFTHWFHPLTGGTAEKHDAFIIPQGDGQVILQFSGKELTQGEPDASSFPSGGIRETFEARGYTAWDPTSPAFIRETTLGATLCIPTAFCSYTGEALDKKTPLLRSNEAVSKSATKMLNLLGNKKIEYVNASVGLEQEYFLIDMEYYNQRPDMIASGRTLFGAPAYKGQALDDHYFGAIKKRVLQFMQDSEQALYKLGIPVKTRHNEVAPAQYELAPVYEAANVATDHNMLIVEVMTEVAAKHKLKLLVHEKPFAGLNGSGKHCNWSLTDSEGSNLYEPGDTPHDNLQFMIFLTAIIRAIDIHAKLLRSSVGYAGNDHRLGANEAPPAIISAFLGSDLDALVKTLIAGEAPEDTESSFIKLGAGTLPKLPKDTTDRNRTSPFAFTGNKFEFRALGASQHVAGPIYILNTIVSESLDYMSAEIEDKMAKGQSLDEAADAVVRAVLKSHQRVIFNGDGYSADWEEEAARRGLPNLKTAPESAKVLLEEKTAALFEKYNVLSKGELFSRYNIKLEKYNLTLDIEFAATLDIARTLILPAAFQYQNKAAQSLAAITAALGNKPAGQAATVALLSETIESLISRIDILEKVLSETPDEGVQAHAEYYQSVAIPAMNAIREAGDALECLVEDELWPLPKYREMLWLS
ncbi:MAG: glutamine synthetase type III [SAR324 cluster bacterium]|uniref:Glutamine synthetase type III n=1 Tax=SAR324 cluster bacterium TaxID=2024889 RepID=A0A2A4T216_9DELT|nr:MAG: glutamine synthetase type III [SAR324 cluster bacterium]